jgi:hypothetical protein
MGISSTKKKNGLLKKKVIDRNAILPIFIKDNLTGEETTVKFKLEDALWTYSIESYQVDVGLFESLTEAIRTAREDFSILSLDKHLEEQSSQN